MDRAYFTIEEDGTIKIAAYCLKTDSWQDYLAFKDDARHAMTVNDHRAANRYLRAALVCLFAHIEGVVNEIDESHAIPAVYTGTSLADRTRNIGVEARKHTRIPYVNFRLEKYLRDIIAHPGIEKAFNESGSGKSIVDVSTVFERLNLVTLGALESQISPWIDAVCSAFGISRFTDTQRIVTEFSEAIASVGGMTIKSPESDNERTIEM